jgi:hypothetical protein
VAVKTLMQMRMTNTEGMPLFEEEDDCAEIAARVILVLLLGEEGDMEDVVGFEGSAPFWP